jgi:putative salt-induced outer membrane protein
MRSICLSLPLLAVSIASPAAAQLPDGVQAMIDAALETGDPETVRTVIGLARQTNPDEAEQLDSMLADFEEEQARLAAEAEAIRETEIREAGLFDNWSGSGQLGAFRSTGNSSNTGITAGLKLNRTGIDWIHKFAAQIDYQRANGQTTREQYQISYEPNYELSSDFYAYALGQYERDLFQGFSARYAASGGFGYHILETGSMTLDLQGGPAWRRTERTDGSTESDLSGFLSADYNWRISESLKLSQNIRTFLQSDNSTITSTTGLQAKVASNFSVGVNYSIEIDTDPPPGATKTDTLSRVTIIYDF